MGVPPTALKARTGEFTPPGICCLAASKSCLERGVVSIAVSDIKLFLKSKLVLLKSKPVLSLNNRAEATQAYQRPINITAAGSNHGD
jgi:hypothetical protein